MPRTSVAEHSWDIDRILQSSSVTFFIAQGIFMDFYFLEILTGFNFKMNFVIIKRCIVTNCLLDVYLALCSRTKVSM